jgi:hypothetical protein
VVSKALRDLRPALPDIIISNLRMPKMSEFLPIIRRRLVVAHMGTVLVCLRLLLDVDARLRKHLGRRGELVTLIVLILNTIDLRTVPVLELGSDMEELLATTVKLPAALHASLKCVASSRQSSMNALMNSAIWAYTEEKSKKD